jgi:hypothetical protein
MVRERTLVDLDIRHHLWVPCCLHCCGTVPRNWIENVFLGKVGRATGDECRVMSVK